MCIFPSREFVINPVYEELKSLRRQEISFNWGMNFHIWLRGPLNLELDVGVIVYLDIR